MPVDRGSVSLSSRASREAQARAERMNAEWRERQNAEAARKREQQELDDRAARLRNQAKAEAEGQYLGADYYSKLKAQTYAANQAKTQGTVPSQQASFNIPQPPPSFAGLPAPPQFQWTASQGQGQPQGQQPQGQGTGLSISAQHYQPLTDLQNEAKGYRDDLRNGTGRIAGQIAGATGDWLAGMQAGAETDAATRGIGGSGVEGQIRQGNRDTATRAGAKQLGDLAVQREAMLGGAIQGALPITSATPQLALQEKQIAMNAQNAQNSLAQQNYQNQLQASNQAFNQYMAMMQAQRSSPVYSGFTI